jgi:hypothetical protein
MWYDSPNIHKLAAATGPTARATMVGIVNKPFKAPYA